MQQKNQKVNWFSPSDYTALNTELSASAKRDVKLQLTN